MLKNPQTRDWQALHRKATVVDIHAHPSMKAAFFHRNLGRRARMAVPFANPFDLRTGFAKLNDGGVDVLLSAATVPEKPLFDDFRAARLLRILRPGLWRKFLAPPYFEATENVLQVMEDEVVKFKPGKGQRGVTLVRNYAELEALLTQPDASRPIALIHTIEGAHSLEGQASASGESTQVVEAEVLANLDAFAKRGIASITLAHFYPNRLVSSTFPFPEDLQFFLGTEKAQRDLTEGLSALGEKVVEKMVEHGIIIDVAHCTPSARKRIYDIVGNRKPIVASHVGVYGLNPDPYNLEDWELERIAKSGGVVGVIFMNYWLTATHRRNGLNFVAQTIAYIVNKVGIEHVAIGTDFDGFSDPPDDLKESSEMGRLTRHLASACDDAGVQYSDDAIGKMLGANALRVLNDGWG